MKRFALIGVVLATTALAAYSAVRGVSHGVGRRDLAERVAPYLASERGREVLAQIRREPDPTQARAQAARGLLGEVLGGESLEPQQVSEALEVARELATTALAESPSNSTAAMALGGATYLIRSSQRDRRLVTDAAAWEAPLKRAMDLSPGNREPSRFLSMAYLEVWFALSEDKRREARALLADGLSDPATFDRLIGPWLSTAGDLEEAFSVIPAQPFAWERLRQRYALAHEWAAYENATAQWQEVVEEDLSRRIDEASALGEDGFHSLARARLIQVIREVPRDRGFGEALRRALEALPPGPLDRRTAESTQAWLTLCLQQELYTGCPLPESAIARLTALTPLPETASRARAALAGGDLVAAERFEREAADLGEEAWAPYWLSKVAPLIERGDLEAAREALARVHFAWRERPLAIESALALAVAAGDSLATTGARQELARIGSASWEAGQWTQNGAVFELEIWLPDTSRLSLDWTRASARSAATVRVDGARVGTYPVAEGNTLHLPATLGPGLHLLEVEAAFAQDRITPGEVRRREAPA